MTVESVFSMKGVTAYYPEMLETLESYGDARLIIECLGGKWTHRSDEATHELALQHTPRKGLPLITQDILDTHIEGATRELMDAAPAPKQAEVPVFDDTPRKLPFLSFFTGARIPGSQYFGSPWMPKKEDWPTFEGRPMRFVLQLDLSTIPAVTSLPGLGLLTLFKADGYAEDDTDSFVKIYDPTEPGRVRKAPGHTPTLPPSYISDWMPMWDYPNEADLDPSIPFLNMIEFVSSNTRGMAILEGGEEVSEATAIERQERCWYHNFQCDKLGGWPKWCQAPHWPHDSHGGPMECVYQVGDEFGMILGSTKAVDDDHPVAGRGHIFYSPKTGELRFVWDCL